MNDTKQMKTHLPFFAFIGLFFGGMTLDSQSRNSGDENEVIVEEITCLKFSLYFVGFMRKKEATVIAK